jgi:hypothetical protein
MKRYHQQQNRSPERLRHKVARFRQVTLDNPNTHHDALEFADGQIVLLTHLLLGQRASVLQLPVQATSLAARPDGKQPYFISAADGGVLSFVASGIGGRTPRPATAWRRARS